MIKTKSIKEYKRQIYLTGAILSPIKPGEPAVYVYHGKIIRTPKVVVVLEVAPTYVMFETLNNIYIIRYEKEPADSYGIA